MRCLSPSGGVGGDGFGDAADFADQSGRWKYEVVKLDWLGVISGRCSHRGLSVAACDWEDPHLVVEVSWSLSDRRVCFPAASMDRICDAATEGRRPRRDKCPAQHQAQMRPSLQ